MRYSRFGLSAVAGAWLAASFALCACSCHAQAPSTTQGEIDLDVRTFTASSGKSSTDLNNATLSLNTSLASGSSITFSAKRAYGQYVTQEMALEKDWQTDSLQAGIVRMPFGIYDNRETYASGLINYPLVRSDYSYSSVDWGVPGIKWSGGGPKLQVESAVFSGRSAGVWNNQQPLDGAAERFQTYAGTLILGASRWDGYYDFRASGMTFHEDTHLNGLDFRYTLSHLLFRGEYIAGSEGADYSRGWYFDTYYRLPGLEKFTLAGRVEELKPGDSTPDGKQLTLGLRYTANKAWVYSVDWSVNNLNDAYPYPWTTYTGGQGQVTLQVFRRIDF